MVIKLTPEIKEFIKNHLQDDVTKLVLQAKKYPEIPINFVALQIQARQKLKHKLPEWTDNENITYISALSTEQSSSEITAKFKAELVAGNLLIDLTGGMGVDIAYMSKSFENAIYLEQNEDLKTITEQNFEVLALNKIQCFNLNSVEFLRDFEEANSFLEEINFNLILNPVNPVILSKKTLSDFSTSQQEKENSVNPVILSKKTLSDLSTSQQEKENPVNPVILSKKTLSDLSTSQQEKENSVNSVILSKKTLSDLSTSQQEKENPVNPVILSKKTLNDFSPSQQEKENPVNPVILSKKTLIYLDPARRNEQGGKVVLLQDCEPNILEIKDLLFRKADKILLKTSPMLDIDLAVNSLQNVSKVWVVAVDNEVKELLFLIEKNHTQEPELLAVNLSSKQKEMPIFSFKKSEETVCEIEYHLPKKYLYEPNAALMKIGSFKSIAAKYSLKKIHSNSHLYTSDELVNDFAGRIFEIKAIESLDKKRLLPFLPEKKANISIRNFPLTVKQIREKIGVQDGGTVYLIATTNSENQKIVLVCEKM
jgi:THUMP domain-like